MASSRIVQRNKRIELAKYPSRNQELSETSISGIRPTRGSNPPDTSMADLAERNRLGNATLMNQRAQAIAERTAGKPRQGDANYANKLTAYNIAEAKRVQEKEAQRIAEVEARKVAARPTYSPVPARDLSQYLVNAPRQQQQRVSEPPPTDAQLAKLRMTRETYNKMAGGKQQQSFGSNSPETNAKLQYDLYKQWEAQQEPGSIRETVGMKYNIGGNRSSGGRKESPLQQQAEKIFKTPISSGYRSGSSSYQPRQAQPQESRITKKVKGRFDYLTKKPIKLREILPGQQMPR